MPIPRPSAGESDSEFIERCMTDAVMLDEYDTDQRLAICYSQLREGKMELKSLRFELKALDDTEGTFEGYAATFSDRPDSYGDVIERGAFTKTLQENASRIKILWQHNTWEPIGRPLEMREDESGLYVKGKLTLGVQRAREALELMRDGVVTELSIGYETVKDVVMDNVRHLKELRLFDISPVTFAANPDALILAAKFDARLAELEHLKSGRALSAASIEKARAAIDALNALISSAESTPGEAEPEKSTPAIDEGAARLQALLDNIQGYDVSAASQRIDAMLARLTN